MGDAILIQGPGQQGLACVIAAKAAGASQIIVSGLGRDSQRLKVAQKLGATHTIDVESEDLVSRVKDITGGDGVDVVVNVTGGGDHVDLPRNDLLRFGSADSPHRIEHRVEHARSAGLGDRGEVIRLAVRKLVGKNHHVDRSLAAVGPRHAVNRRQPVHRRALERRRELHLLPLPAVREWFVARASEFPLRRAQTRVGPARYTTVGAAVPSARVLREVGGARRVGLAPRSAESSGPRR